MIDIVDVLDLLESCVRDHGECHRPPARNESAMRPIEGQDTGRAATDSLVTLAMARAGTPIAADRRLAGTSVGVAYAAGQNPFNLTLGAVVVFSAAESAERCGQTWGIAFQAALRAASKYLDLLPDSVVERAVEATAARPCVTQSEVPRWQTRSPMPTSR